MERVDQYDLMVIYFTDVLAQPHLALSCSAV
jgi:hypothetical protein